MEPDTVLPSERSSRNSRSVNTPLTFPHSAEKTVSREPLLASGNANIPIRRSPEEPINSPPPLPSLLKPPFNVSED